MFINIDGEGWNVEREYGCDRPRPSTESCRLFRLVNVTFASNTAEFGAGGLFISHPERILTGCDDSNIEDWMDLLTAWQNNDMSERHCFVSDDNSVRVI